MTSQDFPENLRYLIEEFNRSGLRELHVRKGDFELLLSHIDHGSGRAQPAPSRAHVAAKAATAPTPAPAQQAEKLTTELSEGAVIVVAPNLGTFYRSPKPGAPPFVEVGSQIAKGDELCLIEVMKLFTALKSEVTGRIEALLVEDGAMVEAGQPLFAVRES